MSNPYLDFGIETVPFHRRRKLAKEQAQQALTPEEKRQAAQIKLHELWLEDFNKQKLALLRGPYGPTATAFCIMLTKLRMEDGDKLIELSRVWQSTDKDTRFMVLRLIDSALVELRERHMLSPFDDPLDDDLNVFLIIRRMLS
jgi:hypothetical protein